VFVLVHNSRSDIPSNSAARAESTASGSIGARFDPISSGGFLLIIYLGVIPSNVLRHLIAERFAQLKQARRYGS